MTPVGVFFCWQGGAERDFVNSTTCPVMIAMLDGIGMNGLYFRLYMGE